MYMLSNERQTPLQHQSNLFTRDRDGLDCHQYLSGQTKQRLNKYWTNPRTYPIPSMLGLSVCSLCLRLQRRCIGNCGLRAGASGRGKLFVQRGILRHVLQEVRIEGNIFVCRSETLHGFRVLRWKLAVSLGGLGERPQQDLQLLNLGDTSADL
jgi:hypothetical protein